MFFIEVKNNSPLGLVRKPGTPAAGQRRRSSASLSVHGKALMLCCVVWLVVLKNTLFEILLLRL